MITIILCKGKGLDSEELSLFEQEKIAGISLFERSLISLSNESFTESFIISDKEYPLNELYKRHKNFNIQTKPKIDDFLANRDVLLIQNNVVANKKQIFPSPPIETNDVK